MLKYHFNHLILIIAAAVLTAAGHCSIFDTSTSCTFQDNGYCVQIEDEGSVDEADIEAWWEERKGEYEENGCSDDGLIHSCEYPEETAYAEVFVEDESKGNLSEVIFFFYDVEISIPISEEQTITYLDSKDFCDDADGDFLL